MMLQSDLHNPANKRKMTQEGFLRNNRGIDDGVWRAKIAHQYINQDMYMKTSILPSEHRVGWEGHG